MLPNRSAVRFEGDSVTWSELRDRVNKLADALMRRGVHAGDRVAVIVGNRPEFIVTVLATTRLGAIAVPVNLRLAGPEIAYILEDSGAKLVVADDLARPALDAALRELQTPPHLVGIDGADERYEAFGSLIDEDGPQHHPPDVPEGTPALIMYTSGTTGRPKGAVLCHANLHAQTVTIMRACHLTGPDEVNLIASPLFHIGAIGSLVGSLYTGACTVIMPTGAFNSTRTLDLLEAERVTTVFLVPAQWQAVCDDPTITRRDLSNLRVTMWGAAPASNTLLARMAELMPSCLNIATFGQTEMTAVTCILEGADAIGKIGSVGRPVSSVTTRVINPDLRDVEPGEIGEIVYRGPGMMLGYWNNPEATSEAFRGGWFHSGDLVCVDADGYIFVVDRVKDMIISGGENIYCVEVENVLAAHPDVVEVSIVGHPDSRWGEIPVAHLVTREAGRPVDLESLRAWASASLARYKLPRKIRIHDSLPRNASGKVMKHLLRSAIDS